MRKTGAKNPCIGNRESQAVSGLVGKYDIANMEGGEHGAGNNPGGNKKKQTNEEQEREDDKQTSTQPFPCPFPGQQMMR